MQYSRKNNLSTLILQRPTKLLKNVCKGKESIIIISLPECYVRELSFNRLQKKEEVLNSTVFFLNFVTWVSPDCIVQFEKIILHSK